MSSLSLHDALPISLFSARLTVASSMRGASLTLVRLMVIAAVSARVPSEACTVSTKLGVVSKSSTLALATVIWPVEIGRASWRGGVQLVVGEVTAGQWQQRKGGV